METITLYFRQGASDKIYQAAIEPKDGGYTVNFAYGRRGSTLNTGTKTQSPVSHAEAKAIYDKLVKEKTAKGYTPGADGTPYQQSDKENQITGILPQLLNPIEEDQVGKFIEDPAYWMQEKWDGRRLLIRKQDGKVTGINKLGLAVALPEPLVLDANHCDMDFILDGEAIGDMLCVFDALLIGDEEIGGCRYTERLLRLMNLLASFQHPAMHLVETHFTAAEKRDAFQRLKAANAEGVVFKHTDAPYIAGSSCVRWSAAQIQVLCDRLVHRRKGEREAQRHVAIARREISRRRWQCDHPAQSRNPAAGANRGVPLPLRLPGERLHLPARLSRRA